MKFTSERPFAGPEKAARRLTEIASTVEPVQVGRIFIEKINGPFLFGDKDTPAEYGAGPRAGHRTRLARTASKRLRFTQAGSDLFA
jgi:hypothetical protein